MWKPTLSLLALLCLLQTTFALHESDAGVVDWHKPLIGVPLTGSLATAPVFHRVGSHDPNGTTQSVILTATASNVLGALEPASGNLTWRHIYEPEDPVILFRAREDIVVSLSGPGGSTFRSFDALTGQLISEKRLHRPDTGRLFEPANLGSHVAFPALKDDTGRKSTDVFVLTNGCELRRIDAMTGEVKWTWSATEEQKSFIVFSRVVSTPSAVYAIGLTKTPKSYMPRIEAISPTTGEVLASADLPGNIQNGLAEFMVISDSTDDKISPLVIWLESGTMKTAALQPSLKGKVLSARGAVYKSIKDVGLSDRGLFVALQSDDSARIIKIDDNGPGVKSIHDFADSATSTGYTESMFAGGLDKSGYPYVGRFFWSHNVGQAAAHVYSPHLVEGRGMVTGYTFSFDTNLHGTIEHVALDTANPKQYTVLARLFLTTSTGAVQLWQHDRIQWTREESLSEIKAAEFVELPERKAVVGVHAEEHETFGARLIRQLADGKEFPTYAVNFAKRFATGSYASVTNSAVTSANSTDQLYRDTFGFRKIIVAATSRGKIYGINSSNGAIIWSRILGLGWANEVGGRHQPVKVYVTKTVSDGDTPQVVLLTQRLASNGLVDTVIFHINALTGDDIRKPSSSGPLEGFDFVESEIVDAFLLQSDNRTVVAIDTHLQVHLYPNTEHSRREFSKVARKIHFPLRANGRLLGHQVLPTPEVTDKFTAYATWASNFPPQEQIVAVIPNTLGPVASLGKVLGNRTTLYKYLNPHLIAVGTISPSTTPPVCGVYLLDGAKGTILYHANVPAAGGVCDVMATLTENWLVYVYYDDEIVGLHESKGQRAVSVELYEGYQVNDKTKSSDTSIYSNKTSEVSFYEQSYILPYAVTAMSTTSTKFGISVKDIILTNRRNQIHSIPRRVLDPRRPKRKPTAEEQEEWLFQYEPLLPDDPRRVVSHNYRVAKVEKIITSPAFLESTSLIFAYGLDLFSTRVAPSNTFDVLSENFNKAQLVLTVSALAIAIIITKPMVSRKRLRERWYAS
ncbi:DUF1620-domain-containing protein [Rickenella mellea]|uniref:ER membrane protein complex subunit 1 n=1 Tax=Rickenella mellea TaxID=50990 RepID=A0A4Y7QIJ0_9AGAM|nr:DUF1620-domain-containing protein [Rickenella mellea]